MINIEILLVEDNPSDVELISEALADSLPNYNLRVASDGDEALTMLRSDNPLPHVILLDLNLPKISGLDVLREVKTDYLLQLIPVIIFTNSKAEEDIFKAYRNHANAYVRKPLGYEALVEAISATGKFWFEVSTLPEQNPPQPVSLVPGT